MRGSSTVYARSTAKLMTTIVEAMNRATPCTTGRSRAVDVRSKPEFVGEIIAPPGMTETAQRAGHVPGARNVPWSQAVAPDGTFKPFEELLQLYKGAKAIDGGNDGRRERWNAPPARSRLCGGWL